MGFDDLLKSAKSGTPDVSTFDDLLSQTAAPGTAADTSQYESTDLQGNTQPAQGPLQAAVEVRPRQQFTWLQDPSADMQGFGRNLVSDIQDLQQGFTAMGSELQKRASLAVGDPSDPTDGVPFFRLGYNQDAWKQYTPDTADDLTRAGQMAGGMLTQMYRDYADPAVQAKLLEMKGRPDLAFQQLQRYPQQAFQKPLITTMDLAPVTGYGAKGVAKAGSLALKGLSPVINKIPLVRDAKLATATQQIFGKADRAFRQERFKIEQELDDLYNAIPDEVKPHVIPGAEFTDETSEWMVQGSDEARKFLDKVDEYNDQVAAKAKQAGLLTDDDILKAKYGPTYMKYMHDQGTPIKAGDLNNHLNELHALRQQMDSQGLKPSYFGVIKYGDRKPKTGSMLGDFGKSLNSKSRPNVPTGGRKPTFMEERQAAEIGDVDGMSTIRDASHSMNALDVAKKRIVEGLRFFQLRDTIDELVNNPTIQKAQGSVPFNAEEFLKKTAVQAGMGVRDANKLAAGLPAAARSIQLPKGVAEYLKNVSKLSDEIGAELDGAAKSKLGSFYRKSAQVFRRWILGYDWTWPVIQFFQGGTMFLNHALSPQGALTTLMAAALSVIPSYRKIVPPHLLADFNKITELTPSKHFPTFQKVIDFIPDKLIYPAVNWADNQWRIAGTLHEGLKRAGVADLSPGNLEKVITNSLPDIEKAVFDHYGDFRQATTGAGKLVNDTINFFPWLAASIRITKTTATQHPYKTAIYSQSAQAAPEVLQDREKTPDFMWRGGAVAYGDNEPGAFDPNGNRNVMWKPGFMWQNTPLALGQQALGALSPELGAETRNGISWNPFIGAVVDDDYSNPNLLPWRGGFITQDVFEQYVAKGKAPPANAVIHDWKPDPVTRVARTLAPSQTNKALTLKEMLANEGAMASEGSQFFGPPAPQRIDGGKIRQGLYGNNILQTMLAAKRFDRTQSKFTPDEEKKMERNAVRKTRTAEKFRNKNRSDD